MPLAKFVQSRKKYGPEFSEISATIPQQEVGHGWRFKLAIFRNPAGLGSEFPTGV
jgi:hypothetical protein